MIALLGGCGETPPAAEKGTPDDRQAELRAARRRAFWHPRDLDTALTLGQISYDLKAYNDAYAAYRRAAALDPESLAACLGMARTSAMLHDPGEALDWIRRAERLAPGDPDLIDLKGRMLLLAGRLDDAVEVLQRATRLSPQSVSIHLNLASAYATLGRHQEAVRQAQAAGRLAPNDSTTQLALAMYLDKAGEPEAAEQAYRRALKLEPGNHAAMLALAQNLVDRKRGLGEARRLAQAAAKSEAQRPAAALTAAWALHLQGQTEKAAGELGKFLSGSPHHPGAWRKLVTMIRALRDSARARGDESAAEMLEERARQAERDSRQFIGLAEPLPAVLSPIAAENQRQDHGDLP
mgnify:CR=1 FL=1